MSKITVKAKITSGTHPVHGPIIKGNEYTMDEHQFAPQLFERPSKDWKAPWERKEEAAESVEDPQDNELKTPEKPAKKRR